MNIVEIFLSEARQHPRMPCEALKFSSQLPASFLEDRGGACWNAFTTGVKE